MDVECVKQFSVELSQVMDDIGVNEEMKSLRRHVSLLMDRFENIRWDGNKQITFGSQSEGSTTDEMMSDTDKLVYIENHLACEHLSDCQDSKTNYIVLREPMSLPQCCCLQLVRRCKRCDTFFPMNLISATGSTDDRFIFDIKGRMLFNSTFFFNTHLKHMDNPSFLRVRQHGPACTCYHQDFIYTIQCLTLPDNCRYLFKRPRPGHWPSHETLLKAEQCCVYLGHPGVQGHRFGYDDERRVSFIQVQYENKYIDSQFRMSTNMIERLLMFDLSIVQMKAYVITKMIRKVCLQPLVDERLSTFHMKTSLLFTIEQFPEDIWRDDNLVQCVIYCLNTLKRFLKRGYCPHYTISSVNLFAGKLTKNELQILNEQVTQMVTSSLICLRKLRMDSVGCRLSASSLGV
ncbi:hypothetical protein DPMN_135353 [Dreissena polymorpha]|uniref:Mab-21-like HhH/H2TH-like domain-containing protein n=1 Tax=Dreissena polymorpha TaxID=45954 RepID=A0A9D4JBK6_DREPO|nr:hypothetical protein DPMN_135353 [Dreissena polymorpha]